MNCELIKTSNDSGAVFFKYRTHRLSPEYQVTLPFRIDEQNMVNFAMTEETLRDLVNIFNQLAKGAENV